MKIPNGWGQVVIGTVWVGDRYRVKDRWRWCPVRMQGMRTDELLRDGGPVIIRSVTMLAEPEPICPKRANGPEKRWRKQRAKGGADGTALEAQG